MMPRLSLAANPWASRFLFVFVILLSLFAGVSCQRFSTVTPEPIQTATAPKRVEVTAVSPPEEVRSPETGDPSCAFIWASQDLPEVAQTVRKALQEAGLPDDVEARANAFGENCVDPTTGSVVRFLPMQTDFSLVVPVVSIDDAQELGEWIEEILPIIGHFPPGQVPGPNPGYLQIRFIGGAADTSLRFPLETAQNLLRDGLRGSALYRALESQ